MVGALIGSGQILLRDDMRRIAIALIGTTALSALLAGCQVGPNYTPPPPPAVAGYAPAPLPGQTVSAPIAGGAAQTLASGQDVNGRWWTLYQSPELDALVDQALKANPDLKAAQAALRVAREAYLAQRGAALPTLDAGYSASRQQVSAVDASPLNSNIDVFNLHTAQLNIGYVPDVFGALRRQTENAQAQAEAQRFQTEAAYLTLTTNVVAAAIQQASLAQQIKQTEALIASDRKGLDLMRQQQRLGEIATSDVAAQAALVAQAEQTLPPLHKALAQQNDLLADLTGRFPSDFTPPVLDLAKMQLPADLPVSLPSKLVEQRPDIRAAAANVHAASAGVGVAIAARLPSFPLSVSAGGQSTDIPSLIASQNLFYALTGGVTAPIYEGGQLKHKQRGAEAALDQAKAQYQSAVLSAFQNVADSLQALHADARTLQAAANADAASAESLRLAQQQYAAGQSTSLSVLTAEQTRQQALLAVTQAQAARYADTAALFQALGGGWWNRSDIDLAQIDAGVRPGR
jgi:NodT family efflux transporter outer membrane factor (OMF) lipoprotein